jgi:N-methylhydantoinase A
LRHREANLGRGFESVGIYCGPDLVPGDVVSSPAIIEETLTTIVVYPGWEAVLDESSDYLLRYLD